MAQQRAGITRQQVEFFNSKPAAEWVFKSPNGGHPYIPANVVEAALCAGCGPGGWSLDIIESEHKLLAPFTNDKGETVYTVIGIAKVRIAVAARDDAGHLIPGVEAFHVEGVDSHALVCKSPGGVGSLIGNALKAAASRALRSAACRIGDVFGRSLMHGRGTQGGGKAPVGNFTSQAWPTFPEFPCVGDAAGHTGFDAARLVRDAAAGGGGEYDYDDDGEAYDPSTGVVQRAPEPAQQRRQAPAEPAQQKRTEPAHASAPAPTTQTAPQQQREPSAAPAPTQAAGIARPRWMSVEDHERIGRNDVVRDDHGPWVVSWVGPDGQPVGIFAMDPSVAVPSIIGKLNMPQGAQEHVRARLRNPDDKPFGAAKGWPPEAATKAQSAAQPTQQKAAAPDRLQMFREIREAYRRAEGAGTADAFGARMQALGIPDLASLRTADDATLARAHASVIGGAA